MLPFTLLDHKKRVASRDYFIINPLGSFDCLNIEKTDIAWSKEVPGRVVALERPVLSEKKLKDALAIAE